MDEERRSRPITRRDFLKLLGVGGAGVLVANSGLGEYLEGLNPEIPELKDTLSEYKVGWQARPWVWTNLAIASRFVDNTTIQPGQEVSLISLMKLDQMSDVSKQNTDPTKGYIAGQMWGGIDGLGYGLCLASTAVFRASLSSPLRITHRDTHYDIYSAYFKDWDIGTDAAVYYPDPGESTPEADLRLLNPTDNPLTINFGVYDGNGGRINVPDGPLPDAWYKAAYLDQIARIAQAKVDEVSGIEVPTQFIPQETFGNKKIKVRAAVTGGFRNYDVNLSPVATVEDAGLKEYTFRRNLALATARGPEQFVENYISQYGKGPVT